VEPWQYIVLLGAVVFVYAWMIPKAAGQETQPGFVSEETYNELLENLEAENRELFDAVAKFKSEHDDKVDKLARRIVDMESQMKLWTERQAAEPSSSPSSGPANPSPEAASAAEAVPGAYSPEPARGAEEIAASALRLGDAGGEGFEPEPDEAQAEPDSPPNTIRGRYAELLGLHEGGKSVEQIAKAFGMNKGEVQLILQLARREESLHA